MRRGAARRDSQSTCNSAATRCCQNVAVLTAWSTAPKALLATLVAGATAGTSLASWFARPVTDAPTEPTVLPTPAATGVTGLLPPDGGGDPVVPPPGDPPLDVVVEDAPPPVVVAAPLRVTCPPGASPVLRVAADDILDNRAPDPTSPVSEPGAVGPLAAAPEEWKSVCGRVGPDFT
jgi:hypothetical protein